ncbi:MAG: type I DNA topoisomerase [Myxococcales bacterium]|nr:type I DNA topoisomerase [Myxococcales bacterium]
MSKPLVIVESPAKAKTIAKFLGEDAFTVMASVGHVVDLPSSGLCVDVENDFKLTYEVTKKDVIASLKLALKDSSELYLATDEDREGEAIAWHLKEQLKPKVPTRRMVFHEITKTAIAEAVANPRDIDMGLVDAQEARRTLDRLYGYEVSPVLWRKVKTGLSAGRVQSPSIRLIVERERERMAFRSASYWDLAAKHPTDPSFDSQVYSLDGQRVAQGRDFDSVGKPTGTVAWLDEAKARGLMSRIEGKSFTVSSTEKRPYRSSPKAPFMTSTLQQEGGRKLGMSAQQVMRVAQGLYERGYITYMRTDSTNLSETAVKAARAQVAELFGDKFLPSAPRVYAKKTKNAQEAHEAVRPAGEAFRTPEELKAELAPAELRLYDLIWKRTLACQMSDAEGETVSLKLGVTSTANEKIEFSASGRTITFRGYMQAYVESTDERDDKRDDEEAPLPILKEGDTVPVSALEALGHTTSPPARFTEASLVKKLEEIGVGRPSTYASILGTLQAKYVWKKGSALIPNWEAFAVVQLMEKHFLDLVDLEFTKEMEEELDKIAGGEREKTSYLKEFYYGDKKHQGLKKQVSQNIENIDAAAVNSIPIGDDPAGVPIVVKPGRYGPYLKRGEDTVSVPDALAPDEMTVEKALALLSAPKGDTPVGIDPVSNLNVYVKTGRFGPYVQLGEVSDDSKPKTASLFKTMKPEEVTLAQALELLQLPRVLGTADDGEEITAQNGRYGPYLTKGKDSRNLGVEAEPRLLTITMAEALEIFAQPKQFRGRGQASKPSISKGIDPVSTKEIFLKEGRFGWYVTDGETNATLRRGDTPEDVTNERAVELIAARREYMASPEGQARAAQRGQKQAAKKALKQVKAQKAKAEKAAKTDAPVKAKAPKAAKAAKAPPEKKKAVAEKAAKPAKKTAPKKKKPEAKKASRKSI